MANTAPTVHRIPLANGQADLSRALRRVHLNHEYVILEQDGVPVAGLMDADELEDYLEVQDPKVRAQIRRSTQAYRAGKGRPAEAFLAELQKEKRPKKNTRRH